MEYRLSKEEIKAIERVLNQQDKVELVPLKEEVKINRIKREPIKTK